MDFCGVFDFLRIDSRVNVMLLEDRCLVLSIDGLMFLSSDEERLYYSVFSLAVLA